MLHIFFAACVQTTSDDAVHVERDAFGTRDACHFADICELTRTQKPRFAART